MLEAVLSSSLLHAVMVKLYTWLSLLSAGFLASSLNVTDIQGPSFQSPYAGKNVSLIGVVSAKGKSGFYLTSDPVEDARVSNGLYVFSTSASVLSQVTPGDMITVDGAVSEYRSASRPGDLFLTELSQPSNIIVITQNVSVTPVVLGQDRSPPTQLFSALDDGPDGFLSIPNNSSQIETTNATLQPDKYGLDFWESLEGVLVQIPSPVAMGFPNSFGEFWVYGDWNVTGKNERGGLTMTFGPDGIPDGNPEAVIVGSPLDGTKNPKVALGTTVSDITGIVTYQFGFYYVLPLTAPTVLTSPDPTIPASTLDAATSSQLTVGDYNIENMSPNSSHLPTVAGHICNYLRTPDLLFLQEVQDNSGETDDGVVSANLTMTAIVAAINDCSGVAYNWTQVDPEDGEDGGVPGGNIRQAYLYNPEKLSLAPGVPAGTSTEVTVVSGESGKPSLSLNPGRIDPSNAAWTESRKPLVAEWVTSEGGTLFTINLHLSSKGGSSSTEGDARPPVNLPSDQRTAQVETVATFVQSILDVSGDANIIVAGDMNEFTQTRAVLSSLASIMTEIEEAADLDPVERYTYVFDQNSEQLDHMFISDGLKDAGDVQVEHIHVNTWAPSFDKRVSDHDPSVALVTVQ